MEVNGNDPETTFDCGIPAIARDWFNETRTSLFAEENGFYHREEGNRHTDT
jgi:hypothetical protein